MKKDIYKEVLSDVSLYYGAVDMPKDWEIDRNFLSHEILQSKLTLEEFKFSRTFDKLNKYVQERMNLRYNLKLLNKNFWGDTYHPLQNSEPLKNIDPVDLRNSPDFTMLYGVNVNECIVKIYYDDNRKAGRFWEIPLINNRFIIFPSCNLYTIKNFQKENTNYILTVTYELG